MISDFTIVGSIFNIEQARERFKSGVSAKNNREWKMINIGIRYWDQNKKRERKEFITFWGDEAEMINTMAHEGQNVEVICRLNRRLNEKTNEWGLEISGLRIKLDVPENAEAQETNKGQKFINEINQQIDADAKTEAKGSEEAILWD